MVASGKPHVQTLLIYICVVLGKVACAEAIDVAAFDIDIALLPHGKRLGVGRRGLVWGVNFFSTFIPNILAGAQDVDRTLTPVRCEQVFALGVELSVDDLLLVRDIGQAGTLCVAAWPGGNGVM